MKDSQAVKKDPTRGVRILFIVVVALVICGVLYKALTGLHAYKKQLAAGQIQPMPVAPVSASVTAASKGAGH